jgi:2',3'-cyclic-nucleotide 2'-phosphodiesterase/3'-nucleotidase
MALLSHDYYSDQPDPAIGLSRTASLIARARAEASATGAACLLLDNGDGLQGTPLGDLPPGQIHPLMRAFGALRYDAAGLGNHDFNYGLERLSDVLSQAPCPVICSNMTAAAAGTELPFAPHAVLTRTLPGAGADAPPVRIGLLSVLPPQTVQWDAHHLKDRVRIAPAAETARRTARALREAGCEVVIALAHTGLSGHTEYPGMENALRPVARIAEIDAVVAGHTHLLLPCDSEPFSKPVVMPGSLGSHLGVIDLDLRLSSTGWSVTGSRCTLRPIARRTQEGAVKPLVPEDLDFCAAMAEDHAATRKRMEEPVGYSNTPLHSYFTFFAPDPALSLVACAQAAAVRPLVAGTAAAGLPLLSAVSPAKFGARAGPGNYTDVDAGPLCLRHVADLYVFPNELRAIIVSGAQIQDWLEMAAGLFNQITPGTSGQPAINADRAGHNFDVLYGLEYEIDLSQPARFTPDGNLADPHAQRVRNITWNGQPMSERQHFAVAVNNYRASGGGNFRTLQQASQIPLPPLPVRDVVRDYLAGRLPQDPLSDVPAPWRLAAMPGTEIRISTGPGARPHLHELDPQRVAAKGLTEDGFLSLAVAL